MNNATTYNVTIAFDGDLYFGTFSVNDEEDPGNAALRHCKADAQGYGDSCARTWEEYISSLDGACFYPVPPMEAAAPDLLEALRAILIVTRRSIRTGDVALGSPRPCSSVAVVRALKLVRAIARAAIAKATQI